MGLDDGIPVDWDDPEAIRIRSADHPEANGRTPTQGDASWRICVPLDTGHPLVLEMGTDTLAALEKIILAIQRDRALEAVGVIVK